MSQYEKRKESERQIQEQLLKIVATTWIAGAQREVAEISDFEKLLDGFSLSRDRRFLCEQEQVVKLTNHLQKRAQTVGKKQPERRAHQSFAYWGKSAGSFSRDVEGVPNPRKHLSNVGVKHDPGGKSFDEIHPFLHGLIVFFLRISDAAECTPDAREHFSYVRFGGIRRSHQRPTHVSCCSYVHRTCLVSAQESPERVQRW